MTGTPRNERYGSSPASRKYLKRGCVVGVGDDLRPQLLGDEAGQPFGQPHPDAADAFGPQADGRRQHEVGAIGLEQIDGADVGLEPVLNQVDELVSVSEALPLCEISEPISSSVQSVRCRGWVMHAGRARTLPLRQREKSRKSRDAAQTEASRLCPSPEPLLAAVSDHGGSDVQEDAETRRNRSGTPLSASDRLASVLLLPSHTGRQGLLPTISWAADGSSNIVWVCSNKH